MSYKHRYTDTFYSYIERGSVSSARTVLPILEENIKFESVVDVGCGRGAWLSIFKEIGAHRVHGLDGAYVDSSNLLIDKSCFTEHDLATPIPLNQRFDLVMSLEVAEHISEIYSDVFVDNLVALGDVVMFSAAAVGQGGEFHINEQPAGYWKKKFEARGYHCYDFLRNRIKGDKRVMPWYRYNTFIYANENGISRLSKNVLSSAVMVGEPVKDLFSFSWKVRLLLIKNLPPSMGTFLAEMNSKFRFFGQP